MSIVFEKINTLIPFKTCVKERDNTEFLIVSNEKGEIIYLNETSKDFYKLCDGLKSVKDIYDELLTIYDVKKDELEQDLVVLIRDLQWNDILSLRETAL